MDTVNVTFTRTIRSFLWSGALVLIAIAVSVLLIIPAQAAEPPAEPRLRIETGMHTAQIWRISTDRDNQWLATASIDKTVRVWELATGRFVQVLRPPIGEGHEGELSAVAFSPDGETIAAAGYTGWEWDQRCSIYLFQRASGRMLKRLSGLPNVINHLAWSPDGRSLAATLGAKNGVRLYRTRDFTALRGDSDYGDSSYGADFSRDGRLVTSSYDGYVRVYTVSHEGLTLNTKKTAPGGKHPYSVRFSPDGREIAVGFDDSWQVDVLDASTLEPLKPGPDVNGINNWNLFSVAWSSNGRFLYAGGRFNRSDSPEDTSHGTHIIRKWDNRGRGGYTDLKAASDTILDIQPLAAGGIVFGSGGASWGVFDAADVHKPFVIPVIGSFMEFPEGFLLSGDGSSVQFSYEQRGKLPSRFDVRERTLGQGRSGLEPPIIDKIEGLEITDVGSYSPKQKGTPLALEPYEQSRSLAIAPDGQSFVLGTEWYLRRFDRSGKEIWEVAAPGVAWAVNISRDGRYVVGAFSDGTIRWYRLKDREEILALFPHNDRKRWVLWTPSGYFDASPGAADLIGWHLNRRKDRAADFYPVSRFQSEFYRPDIVSLVLETGDEKEAIKLANLAAKRSAAPQVAAMLPPTVDLLSPGDGTKFSSQRVQLKFEARTPPDAPVIAIRVRVDGKLVDLPDQPSLLGKILLGQPVETEIQVPPKDCEIQIVAVNRHDLSVPRTARLTWVGGKVAPLPEPKPTLYLLTVGVTNYRDKELSTLEFAAADAQAFALTMKKQEGRKYGKVDFQVLPNEQATLDNIKAALTRLRNKVKGNDFGMLLLSGHGRNDKDGTYYFLPYNADKNNLLDTGLSAYDIRARLNLAGQGVVFVDTCRQGKVAPGQRYVATDITGLVNSLLTLDNRLVIFSATDRGQVAREVKGQGAFTRALLEAVEDIRKADPTGELMASSLEGYLLRRVKELVPGGGQTPVKYSPGVQDFSIASVK